MPRRPSKTHSAVKGPQSRRIATEQKLLESALKLFSQNGFDGTTTKQISTEAGINESLIIRYFGGKENLLLELVKRFVEKKRGEPLPYVPQDNLKDELILAVRSVIGDMQKNLELYQILLGRSTADSKLRRKISEILPTKGDSRIIERIEKLRKKHLVPNGLSTGVLMLIPLQSLSAIFVAQTALQVRADLYAKQIEQIVEATVEGLLSKYMK
ncbi:MAG: TetR/AcrR family transcriptional regulator [Bdellovibrionales bacterium]